MNVQLADTPYLLLPVRLETRFLDKYLWIRIYPDQIFVDQHESRLTREELSAGNQYMELVKAHNGIGEIEERRSAWRELTRRFGPNRSAWIVKTLSRTEGNSQIQIKDKNEPWMVIPKLLYLPDRFCAFLYRDGKPVVEPVFGNPVRKDLSLFNVSGGDAVVITNLPASFCGVDIRPINEAHIFGNSGMSASIFRYRMNSMMINRLKKKYEKG